MTQNEWMTSRDSSWISTVLSTGRYRVGRSSARSTAVGIVGVELRLDAGGVDVVVDVVEVPRPLLAEDLDRDVGVRRTGLDRRLVTRGEGEEAEHQDQRHDRVEDLDRHVVAQLHGKAGLALAAAVDDGGPDDEAPGDDADDEQHDPGGDPEADDAVGVVRRCPGSAGQPA